MESVSATAGRAVARGATAHLDAGVAAVFHAEAPRLVALARFFTDDGAAAEHLVQEAFIRLARSAHRIRDPERAAAYVRSIVINLARDHNRRGLVSLRHRPPAQRPEISAEDDALKRRSAAAVVAALRALPRRQRECLSLRYYLDLPVEQVASTLGISVNSVKTHLARGLRAMAAALDEEKP